ncbi:MAG: biotin--[acetyl-CoA-carboxylase] ligase [Kiritimatiellae bacterium]|nr:biotin--[acetyl-CoA-carboxylase] ligase [Kiritimatiellia bacterium]
MTWRIRHREVTESTNKDALGGKPGDVFTAGLQTGGRGRLDHKWLSPAGENLMMSAVVDVAGAPVNEAVTLPLVAGLSVAQAVKSVLGKVSCRSDASEVRVKWPNDVQVAGRKICGILCERNLDSVIIGIGVNVNQVEFDPEISRRATSVRVETGKTVEVDEVRDAVLRSLSENIAKWRAGGFASLLPDLAQFDCLKGKVISVRRTDDDCLPATGICGGIRDDGTLDVAGEAISAGEAHILGNF